MMFCLNLWVDAMLDALEAQADCIEFYFEMIG